MIDRKAEVPCSADESQGVNILIIIDPIACFGSMDRRD
ncbi:hypothetical protein KKY_3873 [Pelagibacterium halotolerans B2]|uniref:Uncharacterized protein n=1 Tax=Pelagibacterium halotolerans (strain DSM 22347 / JCM 15775 / CGMCC 1.7692 / B2) TaxID=1082931 RepID=G4RDU3_PELHB|nr:hypothetical protein KKY_3873 [Pelagibacterium halotolerans B2]